MDLLYRKETATQIYQSAQKYNSVFRISIFNVMILAFRHFRKLDLIYVYEL